MNLLIPLMFLLSVARASVYLNNGTVYYAAKNLVTDLSEAEALCLRVGGVMPYGFNSKVMREIGNAFHTSTLGILLDIDLISGAYRWAASGELVSSDLWLPGEPKREGLIVINKTEDKFGLAVLQYPSYLLAVCQLDVSTQDKRHELQRKWFELPDNILEPLEQMMIDADLHDSVTGRLALHEATTKSQMMLRLTQRLTETIFPQTHVFKNLSIPFSTPIDGLKPGMKVTVFGKPAIDYDRFVVDLVKSKTNEIALQINPRSFERIIVRNTETANGWGAEEREGPSYPFKKGSFFLIEIRVEHGRYVIYVNDEYFADYQHRIHPLHMVDKIEISHDVIVTSLTISED